MPPERSLPRRQYVRGLGLVALGSVAGCSDATGESTPTESSPSDGDTATRTPTATTAAEATAAGTPTDAETAEQTASASPTATGTPIHTDYETTTVRVVGEDGEELGSVTAAIADTTDLRTLGLSDTESLPEDRGMLFVYESVGDRPFVMREMDFGIDIVFADDEGVITKIHHAPAPGPDEDGEDQRYPGRGQYVLEVNYEWTTDRGVEEGDVLEFEL